MPDSLPSASLDLASYEELYKHLHRNPELSNVEHETGEFIAKQLRQHGCFDIHTGIGGTSVAATFSNGSGPTVLLRSDMDGLPVLEQTGLPYASRKRMKDINGVEHPVMHACGHDMHMTCLLAATEYLVKKRNDWSGTLIVVFQQAEERGTGAQAMVDGGLYDKVPVPDVVLGQHVMPFKSGTVGSKSKVIMGACDSYKITLFGRGGHGAVPHTTIDPVLMASNLVVSLQNIVSREIDVINDSAVVTVGSIHGGFAENIIPQSVEIGVDIRTVDTATRDRVVDSIWRRTRAAALASGAEQEPTMVQTRTFPLTYNEPTDEERIDAAFQKHFSSRYRRLDSSIPMSEDVAILATSQNKPCVFWHIGGVETSLWDECEKEGTASARIPSNHSDRFAPAIHPTMEIGIDALCIAALTYLKK